MESTDQLVERVLDNFSADGTVDESERREAQRFGFAIQQLVAPYSGSEMPKAADFESVACHDISAGGLSFYWNRPATFEYVVVALESNVASIRLIGRTTFCVREADRKYRIGCQFVKRLK